MLKIRLRELEVKWTGRGGETIMRDKNVKTRDKQNDPSQAHHLIERMMALVALFSSSLFDLTAALVMFVVYLDIIILTNSS